jgi:16S rRNA (guanine527-N7)-methyltransferase
VERSWARRGSCSTGNSWSEPLTAAGTLLESGLAELDLRISAAARSSLLELAELLASWSQRINLTAHRTPAAIVARLILDAAALCQVLPRAARVVDLGSGAGFPGLPLALLRPELHVLLIEARERRHHFQRAAIRQLAISNVEARRGRAEQLPPEPAPLVIAQALAAPDAVLGLARDWAEPEGWIGIPGSQGAQGPSSRPAWIAAVRAVRYQVPCGGPARSLWLGRVASAAR